MFHFKLGRSTSDKNRSVLHKGISASVFVLLPFSVRLGNKPLDKTACSLFLKQNATAQHAYCMLM